MAYQTYSMSRKPPLSPHILARDGEGGAGGERVFLHVDMDAFFASVEERDNPALRGRPVGVGGGPGNRGVVTSANYIARKYGVKAGMPSGRARRLCPGIILLPVRGRKYVYVSARIMRALEDFSPDVRPLSVDEASLEITGCIRLFGGAKRIGGDVKRMVQKRFGLPCTVGIGPNRLVAKVLANLAKPDGLMVVAAGDVPRLLAPLPVEKMPGIGPATARALNRLGIRTLGRLAAAPDRLLKGAFGVWGPALKEMAQGAYRGRMRQDEERGPAERSIGHQRTYADNITDTAVMRSRLVALAEMVGRRTRRGGLVGRVLTLTIRYADFTTISHQSVLPEPTDDEADIITVAWRLLDEALEPERPVRLLGISLGRLVSKERVFGQGDLFWGGSRDRSERLYSALDDLRDRFGEHVVARALGGRWEQRRRFADETGPIPPGSLRGVPSDVVAAEADGTG